MDVRENNSESEVLEANDLYYNMAKTSEDENICSDVVISIEYMLKQLPPINEKSSIYRVSKQLRHMNPKAYTPQVISIGPFHHQCDQMDFKVAEQYKLQGLINFLGRIGDKKINLLNDDAAKIISLEDLLETGSLKTLVGKAHSWIKEARNCYAEPIDMDDRKFLRMMLVDACFMVELFILEYNTAYFSLLYQRMTVDIFYDLMKLENQVLFFLLQNLFYLIPTIPDGPESIIDLVKWFVLRNWSLVGEYKDSPLQWGNTQPKHLVDFLSFYLHPPPNRMQQNSERKKKRNFLNLFRVCLCCLRRKADEEVLLPPSITKLCEAGVTIKKAKDAKYLMDISFKNGVLKIPPLHIYDDFKLILRNVLAFEQLPTGSQSHRNKYLCQYVIFLDHLISTKKDVHLLVEAGVIINNIGGSDKEVSDLFNNLNKFVTIPNSTHYDHISKDLRAYCDGWWNKAKASLKHNYFNTPWAFISFFAATFLILLTLLQTIFSVFPH
ncbi:UPF0481 protein At3g47200-like [Benincasa hispida]|uniref:UPF0481 protein At3g47200-like n=1 Tax=Benincasa hispida TaxID=102211 RepID=UPI0019000D11|nr:UPF0481 protein At3g47200-like [Benincasa hispida]